MSAARRPAHLNTKLSPGEPEWLHRAPTARITPSMSKIPIPSFNTPNIQKQSTAYLSVFCKSDVSKEKAAVQVKGWEDKELSSSATVRLSRVQSQQQGPGTWAGPRLCGSSHSSPPSPRQMDIPVLVLARQIMPWHITDAVSPLQPLCLHLLRPGFLPLMSGSATGALCSKGLQHPAGQIQCHRALCRAPGGAQQHRAAAQRSSLHTAAAAEAHGKWHSTKHRVACTHLCSAPQPAALIPVLINKASGCC